LRILQVHTRYRQPGGEDVVVDVERGLLEAAGHRVETQVFDNPANRRSSLVSLARSAWNSESARRVLATAQAFRPDVVHVHNTWFALSPSVFPVVSGSGFPVVATIHNYRLACVNALLYRDESPCLDCVGRLPWPGVLHRCYRDSALQSAAVAVTIATHRARHTWHDDVSRIIVLTRFAADILVRSGVPERRIVVKPNAVTDPGPRQRPPSTSDSILYVGRFTEEKGVLDLLHAWGRAQLRDLRLTMIGGGPLLDRIRASEQPRIAFRGHISSAEVRQLMLEARALVLPSRWFEGMPMVLLEAMAAGLPVVVPDHGALPDIAGSGGVEFKALDVESLAGALGSLSDDALIDSKGASSRSEYLSRYTPAESACRLVSIYADAGKNGKNS
jgi:glycosyltransferase involved in cell wall biosynthesis